MSTTQHTAHYNLPTFGDNENDRPSWRGDFTDAMTAIDNQMYANATASTTANNAAQNALTQAGNALSLAQTNEEDIAGLESYFNALGVTNVQSAQTLNNTINGKAEQTDLTSLQSQVSTLSGTVAGKANSADVYTQSQANSRFTQQGGYSGTAQQIYNEATSAGQTASQTSQQLTNLMTDGQVPTTVADGSINVLGLTGSYNVIYSPITHFVTVRTTYSGTLTGNLPDTTQGTTLFTIPGSYRLTTAATILIDMQPLTNSQNNVNIMPMFLIFGTDGTVKLGGSYEVPSNNALAASHIFGYYVL